MQGITTQEPSNPAYHSPSYQQQSQRGSPQGQQYYGQTQPWVAAQTMPTPPAAEAGTMGALEEFMVSDSLNEAWLTNHDFGQGNWVLHFQ